MSRRILIMRRRQHVRATLFTVNRSGPVVKYIVNPGMEGEAARTWRDHGICLECETWAISGGLCVQCGWNPVKAETDRAVLTA